jgi:hypothetical protein
VGLVCTETIHQAAITIPCINHQWPTGNLLETIINNNKQPTKGVENYPACVTGLIGQWGQNSTVNRFLVVTFNERGFFTAYGGSK